MVLERAIDEWVELVGESSSIRGLKDAKEISKQAEAICKTFQTIKEINYSQARYILERIKKIDAEPPLARKTTFRDKILIQGELRSIRSLLFKEKYLGGIMDKNWEAFMDADAEIVCRDLGIQTPLEGDVLRFKIKLRGHPIPASWDFYIEWTGQKIENVYPGLLDYEGMAKLSRSLLYVDWIYTSKKKSDLTLGPPFVYRPPKTIPLSIIAKVDVLSQTRNTDFDFLVSTPTDIDVATKSEHRNVLDIHTPTEQEVRSYHPLPDFLFSARIERAKETSKDDQEIMRELVIERMKQNIPESPIDIGWKLGVFLSFYKRVKFSPINRGVLTPHGKEAIPRYIAKPTSISKEEYKQGVLDRFEEDGIYHSEGTIGKLSVIWGAVHYCVEGEWVKINPLSPVGIAKTKTDDIYYFCVGVLGFSDDVDKKLVKEFSKGAEKFAQSISPRNHRLIVYPVLMTNSVNPEIKEEVEKTKYPIFNAIVDLSKGKVHFRREGGSIFFGAAEYSLAKPFFERYFRTQEMRLADRIVHVPFWISVECQNCGSIYSYSRSKVETGLANCQNCGKQIEVGNDNSLRM